MKQKDIILQVGVKILLTNGDGRYLLLKRSEKYGVLGDIWDIPGGRINPGFDLITNLKREIREETSLDYSGTPKLIAAQDILRHAGKHVVRLTYMGGQIEGDPVLDDENTAYMWSSLEEMKKMNDLDQYVKDLLDRGLFG
jgi:8-oxo-dGTP diphosphatase